LATLVTTKTCAKSSQFFISHSIVPLMKNTSFFLLCCFLFAFANCTSDKKDLPNTPEKVARQWQDWVDSNQYQKAKELSTGNAINWINWAEETIKANGGENEVLAPAIFIAMNCEEHGNKAICGYILNDEGYEYRDSFYLEKINGQWLVDIPKEDLIEDDTLEELFNKMEETPATE